MEDSRIAQAIIVLAFAATLLRLARTLPWQNVIASAASIAILSGIFQAIGASTGIPFGPFFYTEKLGWLVFGQVPWPMQLLWVVILLNARGVARLILRRWQNSPNHGLWVIAFASLLAGLFDAGVEPIASHANHWWIWKPSRTTLLWYGAPWVNFAGWMVTSFFILALTTPWLIDKKSSDKPPLDFQPLIVWTALMLLLAFGNLTHHLFAATVFSIATALAVAFAALFR
ncbi:MAG TPA: carotenoid biosynthesis protein [Verrucomicrobiae bacterium]|nr:carotenoid biosynthesis protein [Verrucomicrobiae bacterium]